MQGEFKGADVLESSLWLQNGEGIDAGRPVRRLVSWPRCAVMTAGGGEEQRLAWES